MLMQSGISIIQTHETEPAMTLALARIARHLPLALRLSPLRLLAALAANRRSRQALARLDAHLLRDVGLTPDRARAEAARPVWDVPPSWRL